MPTLKARIGGAWVAVGGGSGGGSEVEIAATDPIGTNPSAELWYDTAAGATGVTVASPGLVGYAYGPSVDTTVTSGAPLSGMSVTWNAIAGHTYLTTVTASAFGNGAGAACDLGICDAANVGIISRVVQWPVANHAMALTVQEVYTVPTSGAITRKATLAVNSGTLAINGSFNRRALIIVEDITPATADGLATAWTAPTLINGWLPFGSGWSVPGFRRVGDMVQLRGMVKSGTTGNIFTLPTGYASPNTMNFATVSNDLFCQIRVSGTGVTALNYNNAWVMLDGIQFSVTA